MQAKDIKVGYAYRTREGILLVEDKVDGFPQRHKVSLLSEGSEGPEWVNWGYSLSVRDFKELYAYAPDSALRKFDQERRLAAVRHQTALDRLATELEAQVTGPTFPQIREVLYRLDRNGLLKDVESWAQHGAKLEVLD